MIRKYRYGTPFETDSVVNKMETSEDALPNFTEENEDGRLSFSCTLSDGDCVYGLGENVRGINKRGWMYESRCLDDPVHVETCRSLYAAHNFLIVSGEKTFGIFLDYPGIVSYDIGYSHLDRLVITVEDPDLDIYIIDGINEREIVRELRHLTGRSYIPPKWAFGYQQCRWSYMSEDEIRDVVDGHRKNHIPLDAVYLDIDYMDHYKDFTVNEETFPQFDAFVN